MAELRSPQGGRDRISSTPSSSQRQPGPTASPRPCSPTGPHLAFQGCDPGTSCLWSTPGAASATPAHQGSEENGPKPQISGDTQTTATQSLRHGVPWEGMRCPWLCCGRSGTENAAGSGMTCPVDPIGPPPCPFTPPPHILVCSPGAIMRLPASTRCPPGISLTGSCKQQ